MHYYALCILTGIFLAWWLATKRWQARGGKAEELESVLFVTIVCGIIGARLYHVITDHQLYFGPGRHPLDAFKIWNGGLGIMGGIAGGAIGAAIMCRRAGIRVASLADVLAPALPLAQAIGRIGNWFNQELFGRPLDKPWALKIEPRYRPDGYESYATFTPTFLYEMSFLVVLAAILFWVDRRWQPGRGKLFWLYAAGYTTGRSWVESLRIDAANHVGKFRINEIMSWSILAFSVAMLVFLVLRKPGQLPLHRDNPDAVEDDVLPAS